MRNCKLGKNIELLMALIGLPLFATATPERQNPLKTHEGIQIGWAAVDITPDLPVQITGQFHSRVAEGIRDPLSATALAFSSAKGPITTGVVMVSCDLGVITESLLEAVRANVAKSIPDLDPLCVYLNATHTHTGPELHLDNDYALTGGSPLNKGMDLDLPGMASDGYIAFATTRITEAVTKAWKNRQSGSVGYGLGHAVVGRNRRISYLDGSSRMYGSTTSTNFSHIEGYEDPTVNLLATWDSNDQLVGLIVNVACPSQVSEQDYLISADFWHDTREELRKRFGKDLFILPQCSAAGDLSPHCMVNPLSEKRMARLAGNLPLTQNELIWKQPVTKAEILADEQRDLLQKLSDRKEIAIRLANAISTALPLIARERDKTPALAHTSTILPLMRRKLTEADVQNARKQADELLAKYQELLKDLAAHPEKKQEPRWYVEITACYRAMMWHRGVLQRYELEKTHPKYPTEVHVVRLGDVAFATNPFELYLDFGIRMKARSPAIQTFVVQLSGSGGYLPTARAIAGKSYGAMPPSTPVGPEGGQELVEWTVKTIEEMFRK